MLYSIYTGVASRYPIEDRIAAIRDVGFDRVCLDFEAELEPTETSWENQVRLAEKYRLHIENVQLTGIGMTDVWSDTSAGDTVIDRLCAELRRMRSLGISVGVAHVTWGHAKPGDRFDLGLGRYLRAAEAAEQSGVYLALENSVYPEYLHFLLDHIDSSHIGFCFDSGHAHAFSPEEDYLSRWGHRLMAMHLHDNDGKNDLHAMPFHGTVDWKKTVGALRNTALFSRCITLECSIPGNTPKEGFAAALAEAKKLADL